MRRRPAQSRGFTLIELLVVIAIIGLLATAVYAVIVGGKYKARDAKRMADLHAIGNALEMYRIDTGHYPVALDWVSDCGQAGNSWIPDGTNYAWATRYLPIMPRDPMQKCTTSPPQSYNYWSDGNKYQVTTQLEAPASPGGENSGGITFDGFSFKASNGSPLIATLSSSASSPTGQSPIPFTVVFSNGVVDFTQSSLAVVRGFVSALVALSDKVYNFFVTPTDNDVIIVSLGSNAVHDQTGGGNNAVQYSIQYDSLNPHLALTPAPLPATVSQPFTVTLNSTIAVTDFSAASVSVTNGTASQVQQVAPFDGRNYSFVVTPLSSGTVAVVVPDGVLHSASGRSSVVSNTLQTSYAP